MIGENINKIAKNQSILLPYKKVFKETRRYSNNAQKSGKPFNSSLHSQRKPFIIFAKHQRCLRKSAKATRLNIR